MKKLLILGAGQYGMVAKEVAEAMGCYYRIDFLDDQSPLAVGKLEELDKLKYDEAFVAIGNPVVRAQWLARIEKIATLVHPGAAVSPSAQIGAGCIVEAGAVVSSQAAVGRGSILMANAVVGHNATVGKCCQLKYGCTIAENGCVADYSKVDCNEAFAQSQAGNR